MENGTATEFEIFHPVRLTNFHWCIRRMILRIEAVSMPIKFGPNLLKLLVAPSKDVRG
jgi:hypothetical protein